MQVMNGQQLQPQDFGGFDQMPDIGA
jgi:hypothetical protein